MTGLVLIITLFLTTTWLSNIMYQYHERRYYISVLAFGKQEFASSLNWRNDGRMIALTREECDNSGDVIRATINIIDISKKRIVFESEGPGDRFPTWAPKDDILIFSRLDSDLKIAGIWEISTDSKLPERHVLAHDNYFLVPTKECWIAPQDVLVRRKNNQLFSLCIWHRSTNTLTPLLTVHGKLMTVAISPNKKFIAYVSNTPDSDIINICTYPEMQTIWHQVSRRDSIYRDSHSDVCWMPTGASLLYTCNSRYGWQIHNLLLPKRVDTIIGSASHYIGKMTVSCSGDIAVTGDKGEGKRLYGYHIATRTCFFTSPNDHERFSPSWSPDGKYLAFLSTFSRNGEEASSLSIVNSGLLQTKRWIQNK
jgi:hypothetical protein